MRQVMWSLLITGIVLILPAFASATIGCSVTFDKNPITQGEGTTLRWTLNLPGAPCKGCIKFYPSYPNIMNITNVGGVGNSWQWTGTVWVAPSHTTDYTGSYSQGTNTGQYGQIYYCPATLVVVPPAAPPPPAAAVPAAPPAAAAPAPTCSITFDKNPIQPDGDTTIRWSSSNAELFYIETIGYVGGSGSATVAPESTTDFSGYVNNKADGSGTTTSCPAILTVSGASCPPGQVLQEDGTCSAQCPLGYLLQDGECVFSACPAGYVKQGSTCVLSNLCTTPPKCVGANLVNSCTNATISACAFGCTSGACNPPPALTASIEAKPNLLRIGKTSVVSWSSEHAASCTVVGTNGNSWTGTSSDGKTTSPIQSQTIYTLNCVGVSGSVPPTIDKSVTVNIIPTFNEK